MSDLSLSGRSAVVTGANSGVGRSVAELPLAGGADVSLVCRDRGRGERALAEMTSPSSVPRATLEIADLASPDSVRALAGRSGLVQVVHAQPAGGWKCRVERAGKDAAP